MEWEVEYTNEFLAWWEMLDAEAQNVVAKAVMQLIESGPALDRPTADSIHGSRHQNMKELRPSTSIRILFAFDPRRTGILLIGGDKRNRWSSWYSEMIPVADHLYDVYLEELRKEGLI